MKTCDTCGCQWDDASCSETEDGYGSVHRGHVSERLCIAALRAHLKAAAKILRAVNEHPDTEGFEYEINRWLDSLPPEMTR